MRRVIVGQFKHSGHLVALLPLYARENVEALDTVSSFDIEVVAVSDEPMAFVCDYDDSETLQLMNAAFVKKHIEFLGAL